MDDGLRGLLDAEFGQHFDPAAVDPDARFVFDHPCAVATEALSQALWADGSSWKPHRLRVGFFTSRRLNAGTFDSGAGESVVAISDSLPVELLRAFLRLSGAIDDKSMLPRCDAAGRVVVWPQPVQIGSQPLPLRTNPHRVEDAVVAVLRDLSGKGVLPLALLLYDLAMRFVVMHECMHIVLGHTGYARKELQLSRLLEMSASRRMSMSAELSQSLEFIADRHAAHGVAHWAITGRLGDYMDAAASNSDLPREVFMLRSLTLALMTLLHLLPNRHLSEDCGADSHPHPYQRMRWWCREVAAGLEGDDLRVRGIFEPFAYWMASFQSNVRAPGNWREAVLEDQMSGDGPLPSDLAYERISEFARKWQTRLWREYSPVYPGDGRGLNTSA